MVNHDSGDGWVIRDNTIEDNAGAGLMAGARQQVRGNCLRGNGQYGMNAYKPGGRITGLVVEGNEIAGNNTDDWRRAAARLRLHRRRQVLGRQRRRHPRQLGARQPRRRPVGATPTTTTS